MVSNNSETCIFQIKNYPCLINSFVGKLQTSLFTSHIIQSSTEFVHIEVKISHVLLQSGPEASLLPSLRNAVLGWPRKFFLPPPEVYKNLPENESYSLLAVHKFVITNLPIKLELLTKTQYGFSLIVIIVGVN